MLLAGFLGLWATALFFPQVPAGRLLHRLLVRAPAHWLNAISRRQIIFMAIIMIVVVLGAGTILGAMSADVAMIAAWDASLYVDVLIATWSLAATARGGAALRVLRGRVVRPCGRRATRAVRSRARALRKPANDDDARGPLCLAA
ncbi:MAG: hypothetical protein WC803_10420 [Sphingomonas sp.]|jgi:hypothetical protein